MKWLEVRSNHDSIAKTGVMESLWHGKERVTVCSHISFSKLRARHPNTYPSRLYSMRSQLVYQKASRRGIID